MIDLHSHILPALCDGSPDIETSIKMAHMAAKDGTTHLACTPHIYPGIYNNSIDTIQPVLTELQTEINHQSIPLELIIGADTHMLPEVLSRLRDGSIPTLNNSRYFLLEPAHHVPVIGFLDHISSFINAGYTPIITHPERLTWVKDHYHDFIEAVKMGAWIQVTAGAITGNFGKTAKHFSDKFLTDGVVHIIASDAHGINRRPPIISEGVQAAAKLVGQEEAQRCVFERTKAILNDTPSTDVYPTPLFTGIMYEPKADKVATKKNKSWLQRLFA